MTREERIAVLRKFHIKRRFDEHLKDGFKTCMHVGSEDMAERHLREEFNMSQEEINELKDKFDAEIEKVGIEADQFRAIYNAP